jgi:ATP-binding cassette subfamily D (ALD) protein 3
MRHIKDVLYRRFLMGIYDSMLVKYGAVMIGYTVIGLPVFGPRRHEYLKEIGNDMSKITKDYVRNSSLLINLAKAIGRIVVSYKDVQNLAGYTTLIYELKQVLDDLEKGKYKRVMLKNQDIEDVAPGKQPVQILDSSNATHGEIRESDHIKFDRVPLMSPNGDILINEISFEVNPGMHLMIAGPNGCGKSSLFRILGELWPIFGGRVEKPSLDKIFYIP